MASDRDAPTPETRAGTLGPTADSLGSLADVLRKVAHVPDGAVLGDYRAMGNAYAALADDAAALAAR